MSLHLGDFDPTQGTRTTVGLLLLPIAGAKPIVDVAPHPSATPPVRKLDCRLREVVVATHVGGDAVLVREAEKVRHLTYIDEIIEIYLATHDYKSIHVDTASVEG